MEFDSYKDYIGKEVEDSAFEGLLSQCGLKAIVVLNSYFCFGGASTDIYGNPFWDISQTGVMRDIIRGLDPKYLQSLLGKKVMDHRDIVRTMRKMAPDRYPDFRYDNAKSRDTKGKLFHPNLNGITAMKFEKTRDLHWAVLFGGQVFPLIPGKYGMISDRSYNTMKELRKGVEGFDGFGHTIIYRSAEDIEILKHYKQCPKVHCQDCARQPWCPLKQSPQLRHID